MALLRARRFRNQATTILVTMAVVCVAAIAFAAIQFPERPLLHTIWTGFASGVIIVAPLASWVLFGARTALGRALRRLPLLVYLAVNALLLSAVLLVGHYIAYDLVWPSRGAFVDDPDLTASLSFSIALAIAINVGFELRRLIGPGVFGSLLLGRYRVPRVERRVFLMLDIMGSTAIAERLGPERFFAFLDRWLHVLTEPLLAADGRIDRFIGDEVVVSWEWTEDAVTRAVDFALAATAVLVADSDTWRRDFGVVPRMHGALHAGEVISGEIGDLKREITFLGDTLNTTARIASEARKHSGLMLASAEALAGAALPADLKRIDLGDVALRGKAEPVALALLQPSP
jgi:adenylate cyclase